MKPSDPTTLLRALADVDESASGAQPADALLRRYREGALTPDDAASVEAVLAQSPEARARLAALAGVPLPSPSAAVRERVLAAYAASDTAQKPAPRPAPRRRFSNRRWWAAAAAAAVVVMALGYGLRSPEPLPSTLAYVVTARGIETSRGGGATAGAQIEATADTLVLLSLAAVEDGAPGLAYALYRPRAAPPTRVLERVADHPQLASEAGPGGVVFEAPAAVLVGDAPGEHVVYLVAARRGDLPERFALSSDDDPLVVLANEGRRRAHAVRVLLRASRLP